MAKLRISTANRSAVFQFEEEKLADWHFFSADQNVDELSG